MEELEIIPTFRLKQTFNKIIETIHQTPELREALQDNYPVGTFISAWKRANLPFTIGNDIMIIFLYSLGFSLESISPFLDFEFEGCEELISITLPDNIIALPPSMFKKCTHLKTVALPRRLQIIRRDSFRQCEKLEYLQLPVSLDVIGDNAFAECDNLTTLDYNGTREDWKRVGKYNLWDHDSYIYKIICTDGDIEIVG